MVAGWLRRFNRQGEIEGYTLLIERPFLPVTSKLCAFQLRAVHVSDVEAAGGGDGIDIELQRRLGDAGSGVARGMDARLNCMYAVSELPSMSGSALEP